MSKPTQPQESGKKEILTMRPRDYIVFSPGLKIENTTENMTIEVELPSKFTVSPLENEKL